jgi:general L-amino acid transport system substrate-binding protein
MRLSASSIVCLLLIATGQPAVAGPILDRIRADKVLRCGGVERPGLVEIEADGKAHGLELDMCRALASVVLGSDGRLEFTRYDSDKAFAAARAGHDDVMFLTGRELVENGLTGQVIPGPAIYVERTSVAVKDSSPVQHLEELAGKPICFSLGGHAEFHLHGWFAQHKLDFQPMGFREDGEMNDGYKVGFCVGLAGEATTVAETVNSKDMSGKTSRILPETLAAFPVLAVSGTQDGEWAAVVAWTVETLKRADAPENYWVRGGVASMPVEAPALGLAKGWQKKLVDLVGSYGQIYDRNLGAQSELKLDRGPNGAVGEQGAFAPPYVE